MKIIFVPLEGIYFLDKSEEVFWMLWVFFFSMEDDFFFNGLPIVLSKLELAAAAAP